MDVIRFFFLFLVLFTHQRIFAQVDSLAQFKKKVLESVEVDLLMSYYEQEGTHAAVTGGIGNEYLTDYSPTVVIRIPLNEDALLTADVGFSAYTSASSSNGNPFNQTGASGNYLNGDDSPGVNGGRNSPKGTPWLASTGASRKDVLSTVNFSYQKASEDRNNYWEINLGGSAEYDYESLSFGTSYAHLWNEKNTELNLKSQVFLDRWKPVLPTELHEYQLYGTGFLRNPQSYFSGVAVLDVQGNSVGSYLPENFQSYERVNRNSMAFSIGISQILTPKIQAAIFADVVVQQGLLSNPLQRVYFGDRQNYYIGNFRSIDNYNISQNTDVFHLADDVERLPSRRVKTPIGTRLNVYLSEYLVLRSYYRWYQDDWGIQSNTFQLEIPIRFNLSWKLTPIYRYYDQTATTYFAPYNQHLSSQAFYTSDYDLSGFSSHQWGASLNYRAVLKQFDLFNLGLKNTQVRIQNYQRSDGLSAFILSSALQFVLD